MYAIGYREPRGELDIKGGTGWTCQMYLDQCREHSREFVLYFYNQENKRWIHYVMDLRKNKPTIMQHDEPDWAPPRPEGVYAGIGSRELTADGKRAIEALYKLE